MKRALVIGLFAVLFLVGNTCAIYAILTSRHHFLVWDFHQLWSGTRAIVLKGENPYSDAVTLRIETELYGRAARPDENAVGFFYPLYIVYLVIPVALMPYALAEAAWFSVLELALIAGIIALVHALGWRVRLPGLMVLIFLAGALYPVTWALILGQISLVVFALIALVLWAIRSHRDVWGGFLLAFATVKPQMVFLFVPALLIWMAVRGRWRFVVGFGATFAFLLISSLVWLPTWMGDFLRVNRRYFEVMPFRPPVQLFAEWCGARSEVLVAGVLTVFLVGLGAFFWWQVLHRTEGHENWAVALTLVVTTFVAPRTSLVNQVALLFPLVMIVHSLWIRRGWGRIVCAGSVLLVVAGLWGIRASGIIPTGPSGYQVEHVVVSPILPVILLPSILMLTYPVITARPSYPLVLSLKKWKGGKYPPTAGGKRDGGKWAE